MEPIVFESFDRIELPVLIGGKHYTMKEMTLATGIKIRNAQTEAAIIRDGKIVGTKGANDIEKVVISECLYDDKGKNVPLTEVAQWTDRLCKPILKKIYEISGYDQQREVKELEKELENAKKTEQSLGN